MSTIMKWVFLFLMERMEINLFCLDRLDFFTTRQRRALLQDLVRKAFLMNITFTKRKVIIVCKLILMKNCFIITVYKLSLYVYLYIT